MPRIAPVDLTHTDAQTAATLKAHLAELATHVLAQRGRIRDSELLAAREAGLDDGLILAVVAQVALNVLTNFTNNLAHTDIDFPPVNAAL